MIPEEKIQEIISHLGKKGNKAFYLLDDYKDEIATARDANGLSLLAHAIQQNDGGNVCLLLRCGANPHDLSKEGGTMTHLEYAKKYATYNGRRPYAFEAIESYTHIKESLNMEIMHDSVFKKEQGVTSVVDKAKALLDEEYVSFYHGSKIHNLSNENLDELKNGLLSSPGIQEFSGPTLSLKPIGQYWTTVGFEVKIPRSQVNFPGENKKGAVIDVADKFEETGIALITTEDRTIKFEDYPINMLINLRNTVVEKEVQGTYDDSLRNYADKFEMSPNTINKLNELQEIINKRQPKIKANTSQVMNNITTIRKDNEQKNNDHTITNKM